MRNKYLKILLTLVFAFILNAKTYALVISNYGIYKPISLTNTKFTSLNKHLNILSTSDFGNFMKRIIGVSNFNLESYNLFLVKPIDNVKIFPNPVSTHINITYTLSRDNQVAIKVLDVLGNEILLLLNQKLQAGEQTNTFVINPKIPAGFYFVRIFSGNDSVIKRISVI